MIESSEDTPPLLFQSATLYLCGGGLAVLDEFESFDLFDGPNNATALSFGFVRSTQALQAGVLVVADFTLSDRVSAQRPFEGRFVIEMSNGMPTRVVTTTAPGFTSGASTIINGQVKGVFDATTQCATELAAVATLCQEVTTDPGQLAFCARARQ